MAKFYQYMQPGETLGKITRLKYIDDISDDELIIYMFEDNSKCSEDYIAEINSMDAFNGKYVMVELTDPLNAWKFNTKEFDLNKTKTAIGEDGVEYEIPAPGIGTNGERISVGLSNDGTPLTSGNNLLSGKRTDATPPRIVKNKVVEPKENYLLSLHPELLNNDTNKLSNTVNKPINSVKNIIETEQNTEQQKINDINLNNKNTVLKTSKNPITTKIVETVKHASITINLDDIKNSEYDNIHVILNNKQEDLSVDEFINKLTKTEEVVSKEEISKPIVIDSYEDEDILIKNMIDRSKKRECTIGVDINLELPPKEVYKTIKNVYPDGMAENFVISIARRMDINTLKTALAMGLTAYYENNELNNN